MNNNIKENRYFQFSSVTQSCLTLWDSMHCSIPGLPVHHQLLELAQTHAHWISDAIQLFHPLSSPFPSASIFPSIRVFSNKFFALAGESIGVSASASVLPTNIQDWFPLGLTGWISLQTKGLSRVFSNTTVQKQWSLAVSFLYSPTLTSIHNYWKNHSFE